MGVKDARKEEKEWVRTAGGRGGERTGAKEPGKEMGEDCEKREEEEEERCFWSSLVAVCWCECVCLVHFFSSPTHVFRHLGDAAGCRDDAVHLGDAAGCRDDAIWGGVGQRSVSQKNNGFLPHHEAHACLWWSQGLHINSTTLDRHNARLSGDSSGHTQNKNTLSRPSPQVSCRRPLVSASLRSRHSHQREHHAPFPPSHSTP
ncbi:hypothetical protein O3P69_007398 [Scylla paramamosain]|uniref:Uncharacterized protein n=1 Tax=Scylla paramamosain TaxID=85552 RepID=A0AAW0V3A5_SCYPA